MSAEFTEKPTETTMNSTHYELRERLLEIAARACPHGITAAEIVATAEAFYDFVMGAQSPREKIEAALDAADVR